MQRIKFICLLLISQMALFTQFAVAQSKDRIKDIDYTCKLIDSIEHYQIVGLKNEDFLPAEFVNQNSGAYGYLYAFFRNDSLYKIKKICGISELELLSITEYYYAVNQLVFVREIEITGNKLELFINDKVSFFMETPEFEGIYYFFYDTLFYKLTEGEPSPMLSDEYLDSTTKESQLLYESNRLKELIFNNLYNH